MTTATDFLRLSDAALLDRLRRAAVGLSEFEIHGLDSGTTTLDVNGLGLLLAQPGGRESLAMLLVSLEISDWECDWNAVRYRILIG